MEGRRPVWADAAYHPCSQVSVPVRLPGLGLGVLQLQPDLDGPYTLQSSVRVYLNGVKLSVSRQSAFPVRVVDSGASDFAISNRYMQVWFSGLTGLLKVKGQARGGGEGPEEGMGVRGLVDSCSCSHVPSCLSPDSQRFGCEH